MAVDWMALASMAGPMIASIASNRGQNRQQQASNQYAQDQFNQQGQQQQQQALIAQAQLQDKGLMDRALLDLRRREFSEDARGKRARQAALGDLIKNITAVKANRPSGVPNISFSGGLTPEVLGEVARMSGDQLGRQALMALMQGDKFEDVPMPSMKVLDPTKPTPLPQESNLDKILGIAGLGLNAFSAYNAGRKPQTFEEIHGAYGG